MKKRGIMGTAGREPLSRGLPQWSMVCNYLPPVVPLQALAKSHLICLIQFCYQLLPKATQDAESEYQNFKRLKALLV